MKPSLARFLATGGYIGLIPGAPGTYASLATTVIFYLIIVWVGPVRPEIHVVAAAVVILVGIRSSAALSRQLQKEDPQEIVIDEVAGQLIALFMVVQVSNLVLGFLLFRLFDIWKPFPIRRLEHFKNGWGIMADDILAGVYASLTLLIFSGLLGPYLHRLQ